MLCEHSLVSIVMWESTIHHRLFFLLYDSYDAVEKMTNILTFFSKKKGDSVAEACFCTRAVDKEEDQNYDSSSCFDDSSDNETDEES